MSIRLNINHINMSLYNVPTQIVEDAVNGLQGELMRRASTLRSALNITSAPLNIDIAELAISPLQQTTNLDSASLRTLLVDQLIDRLHEQVSSEVNV